MAKVKVEKVHDEHDARIREENQREALSVVLPMMTGAFASAIFGPGTMMLILFAFIFLVYMASDVFVARFNSFIQLFSRKR